MTFTYSSTDLSTDLAKVRLQIADTNSADPLLTDEEIAFAIADEGAGLTAAAARCAEMILARFARDFNWEGDGTSIDKVKRTEMYRQMAKDLRAKAAGGLTTLQTVNADGWNANRDIDHGDVVETLT